MSIGGSKFDALKCNQHEFGVDLVSKSKPAQFASARHATLHAASVVAALYLCPPLPFLSACFCHTGHVGAAVVEAEMRVHGLNYDNSLHQELLEHDSSL